MASTLTRYADLAFPRAWTDLLAYPSEAFFGALREQEEIRVDEFRENGSLVIRAEAPGIDPAKDVHLTIEDGRLLLQVERRREEKVTEKEYVHEEMHYGQFSRILPLPAGCKEKDVKATYEKGVLEVRIPMGSSEPKRIPIAVKS